MLVHAGPFGNIAHGNSSIVADLIGIHSGDYLITEAGFGADMGAERFFNIKCRVSGLVPDAAVIVTTVRALKAHSGSHRIIAGRPLPPALLEENPDEVASRRVQPPKADRECALHGVTPVVAINAFPGDFDSEYDGHPRDRRLDGCPLGDHHPLQGRGMRRRRTGRGGGSGRRGTERLPLPLPRRCPPPPKIETIAAPSMAPTASTTPPQRRQAARPARANGFGNLPDLHRQDPPVHLLRPDAQGRTDRMAPSGP